MRAKLIQANSIKIPLADKSVQTCVTSPPYYGLRDYGEGDQIGLEQTLAEYIENMCLVFDEVWRVLRDDGTVWLNLGDSYAGSWGASGHRKELDGGESMQREKNTEYFQRGGYENHRSTPPTANAKGFKPKDLMGVPWRVAFALQERGWCLRSEIIWKKPNPMPESVTDRPTKAHEQIFLLCKSTYTGRGYPARRWDRTDARWMGLLIETEGSFICRRYTHNRSTPQHAAGVTVANTDLGLLEEARRIAGCGSILEREGTNLPIYYLQWTTKDAANIAWEIYPHLFKKKRQAKALLYLESRRDNANKGKRTDIYKKDGRHFYLREEEVELRDRIFETVKSLNQYEEVDDSWIPEPHEGKWKPNKYYYDADAIREKSTTHENRPHGIVRDREWEYDSKQAVLRSQRDSFKRTNAKEPVEKSPMKRPDRREDNWNTNYRNKRTVWTVTTKPYKGAHFATFPPDLIEPCILAGTSEKGQCPECGAPWERVVEKTKSYDHTTTKDGKSKDGPYATQTGSGAGSHDIRHGVYSASETKGWKPTCSHEHEPVPQIVLDPFGGSGTTAQVSQAHGRIGVCLDLSWEYLQLARERCGIKQMADWQNGKKPVDSKVDDLPLFQNLD
jgi:DNA modification methylase